MKSIHDIQEVIDAVQSVLGREMNEPELGRFEAWQHLHDDPKSGYNIIEDLGSLAFWLTDCNGAYSLGNFSGGIGLYGKRGGGCWGYLSEMLVEQMQRDGLLEPDQNYGGMRLSIQGSITLRQITARKILGKAS